MAEINPQIQTPPPATEPPPPQQAPAPQAPPQTKAQEMEAQLRADDNAPTTSVQKPDGKALAAEIGTDRKGGKAKEEQKVQSKESGKAAAAGAKDNTGSTMQAVGGSVAMVGGIVAMLPIPVVAQIVGGVIAAVGALTALAGTFVQKNADAKAAVVAGEEDKKGVQADAKAAQENANANAKPNIIADNQPPSDKGAATLDAAASGDQKTA